MRHNPSGIRPSNFGAISDSGDNNDTPGQQRLVYSRNSGLRRPLNSINSLQRQRNQISFSGNNTYPPHRQKSPLNGAQSQLRSWRNS